MKVFNLTLKSKRYTPTGIVLEQLYGTFILEENQKNPGIIKGFIENSDGSTSYINGIYNELEKRLAFLQMNAKSDYVPLLFLFSNLESIGIWSKYDCDFSTFFSMCKFDGLARIEIEEVEDRDGLSTQTLEKFIHLLNADYNGLHMLLLHMGVEHYMNITF